jgi:NAD(P)-dependent dehydrogenase (short-subunit alcohol dehydrogenase family)
MTRGTVLTTGASSGLGLATALELARRGWHSIGSVRSAEKAEVVAKAAAEAGVQVDTVLLDVTDRAACERVLGGLDLAALVNNAGYQSTGAIADIDDDEASRSLETMTLAPMRLARLALPSMVAAGGGRIVNISSVGGRVTMPLGGWYQAAKFALEAATDALRMEMAARNIQVVLIEPGGFRTGIHSGGVHDDSPDGLVARSEDYADAYLRMRRVISPRLMGDPARVGRLVAKVLDVRSPRARYVIGADARLLIAIQHLPTSVGDAFYRRLYGLDGRPTSSRH